MALLLIESRGSVASTMNLILARVAEPLVLPPDRRLHALLMTMIVRIFTIALHGRGAARARDQL